MDDYKNQLHSKRKSKIRFKTRSPNFARRIVESPDYQRTNIQPCEERNITGHEIQSETSIAHLCTTATQAAINNKQLGVFYRRQCNYKLSLKIKEVSYLEIGKMPLF